MKAPETMDIALQSAILALGQVLTARPNRPGTQARGGNTDGIAAHVERVLALVRASPARRLIGVRQNFAAPSDPVRLKAFAYVAWEMVTESNPSTHIETVAAGIVEATKPLCDQLLVVRDVLGRMVGERLLTLHLSGGWSGRLLLPPRVFSWVVGGGKSCGDFDPAKTDPSSQNKDRTGDGNPTRKPLPTARQLFETVRRDVVGLDPQVKVLASRFALHLVRAEALKAGANDVASAQTVVCLVGASGSGKSFTASRLATHCGVGHCLYDTTAWTSSGFVGDDLDTPYRLLVKSVGGDLEEAARGIIFLDEFDKKSIRYGRDVCTLACQQELIGRLQSIAPFVVGGKRAATLEPQFVLDGRRLAYILGGVFEGLDETIEKMAGRRSIGYASGCGSRQHVRIQDAMKEMGFLDELVNRISCVVRLPDPTVQSVERALVNINNGFNEMLLPRGLALLLSESAVRMIAGYAVESRGYYRAAKAVLEVLAEEYLFEERGGGFMIEPNEAKQAIERLTSGIVQHDAASTAGVAQPVLGIYSDDLPPQEAGG